MTAYTLRPATLSVLALLRELERGRTASEQAIGYTSMVGVAAKSDRISRRRGSGLLPWTAPRSRYSGVDE